MAEPTVTMTDRGFQHMEPIEVGGQVVRAYESSAAFNSCLWLSVKDWNDVEVAVHLPLKEARQLARQIYWLSRNHYHRKLYGGEVKEDE